MLTMAGLSSILDWQKVDMQCLSVRVGLQKFHSSHSRICLSKVTRQNLILPLTRLTPHVKCQQRPINRS